MLANNIYALILLSSFIFRISPFDFIELRCKFFFLVVSGMLFSSLLLMVNNMLAFLFLLILFLWLDNHIMGSMVLKVMDNPMDTSSKQVHKEVDQQQHLIHSLMLMVLEVEELLMVLRILKIHEELEQHLHLYQFF